MESHAGGNHGGGGGGGGGRGGNEKQPIDLEWPYVTFLIIFIKVSQIDFFIIVACLPY